MPKMISKTDRCAHCGTANRSSANFCVGCAARLPGFAPTGPSGLELLRDKGRASSAVQKPAQPPKQDSSQIPPGVWLRGLFLGGALLMGLFLAWYGQVVAPGVTLPAGPARTAVVQQQPAFMQLGPFDQDANALPGVSNAAKAAAARSADAQAIERSPSAVLSPGSAEETVMRFYMALSTGNGAAAASLVIPSKRTQGPLSGDAMSAFYGSLREPLILRSVRQVDENVVEARYAYRASRTACDGRALVTLTSAGHPAAIRSIAANC
jgi:hypothetical protein